MKSRFGVPSLFDWILMVYVSIMFLYHHGAF